jgi:anaerobic nitric oxide reductase transcription regulator
MASVSLYLGKCFNMPLWSTRSADKAVDGKLIIPVSWSFGSAMHSTDDTAEEPPSVYGIDTGKLRRLRTRIAPDPGKAGILLLGESGVGKTTLAEEIHKWSRRDGHLIHQNCAEFSDDATMAHSRIFGHKKGSFTGADKDVTGAFEDADKGTLFLDEIGDLPLRIQGLLLLALENGSFQHLGETKKSQADVRLICATNKDLIREVNAGRFRSDLYYRIADYSLTLSPLREWTMEERKQLIQDSLAAGMGKRLDPVAEQMLTDYHWPGNIRQLKHMLKRLCLLTEGVTIKAALVREELEAPTPASSAALNGSATESLSRIPPKFSLNREVDKIRKDYVARALKQSRTKVEAAELLEISVQTLDNYYKKNVE